MSPVADPSSTTGVEALLGLPASRPWWRRPAPWLLAGLLLAALAAAWFWRARQVADVAPRYVTQPVIRGDLALTVQANGTLQPTRSVSVGSELSGTVSQVRVDVNDRVQRGQVLVTLDTVKLADQIARSRAGLASARAAVSQAAATLAEATATLARLEKVQQLSAGQVPAATELDSARAARDRAAAAEQVARASVADAQAALHADETSLSKASIRSPIDGVVLTRSVEPGQAVAASLQAVTLLTLAEDLGKMTLKVNVDEADVGSVAAGQRASFTVSAWPNRRFPALIRRVAFGSATTDNVVTYPAELDVANADGNLRPGMTASATIATVQRQGVLLVPNAALRFTPASAAPAGATVTSGSSSGGVLGKLMPSLPRVGRAGGGNSASGERQVWRLGADGQPQRVPVKVGLSDGKLTEISSGDLQAGTAVIVEQQAARP